jgi:hypothetical protein
MGDGRGSHLIAFRLPSGVRLLPGSQPNELVNIGSFRFSPEAVIYHGLNPFGQRGTMFEIADVDELYAL